MKWINFQTGLRDQTSYLYELESLRGWAITLVVFYHYFGVIFGSSPMEHSPWMSFISSGATGVTLFFVLSAFLLSQPFIKAESVNQDLVSRFFYSRFLRIIPLYYLVVFASMLILGNPGTAVEALLFQYTGFDMFPFGVVWWTLSTEVQFYLALPLVMWLSRFRGGRLCLVIVLLAWAVGYYQLILKQAIPPDDPYTTVLTSSLFSRLPTFLFGVLIAGIYLSLKDSSYFSGPMPLKLRIISSAFIIALLYCLGMLLQHGSALGSFKSELIWNVKHSYEAFCWGALILVVVLGQPLGKFLIVNPVMGALGKLSYSIYLVHLPIQFYLIYPVAGPPRPDNVLTAELMLRCLASAVLIITVSLLTYTVIEKPFLKFKARIPLAK